ncbi:LuxR C-terminal-related transcriptional regulator [Nocardioides sp. LHG3406-4]|uniref:LuxR C-terminal-related transcriptional regulator n=1 Tax=Nocardioides sp. LHG3406-4 TaxID=2804575 RepID=UPI003CF2834F
MTGNESTEPGDAAALGASVDSFLEAKLHWPPSREDWLHRRRLVRRMAGACDHPVTLVAAPAGYGKTILVAQWLEETRPRAGWVSLDSGDNDPNRLWAHVAAALERAGCRLDSNRPNHRVGSDVVAPGSMLSAIVDALAASREDIVLVLDDFHFVREASCHTQVEFLVEHLPPQAHLVVVTRSDPGLRLGRLRASGGLLEIRAGDLGFTPDEAHALLTQERVGLGVDSVRLLMQRTEGWPAGIYLALLSLAGRPDPDAFVRDFSGGNRYIGDYLTEEVLSRHSDEVREFITTVSILDRFSAALCDHVAGITGSASILRELEHSNLFLVPLDGDGRWYRFHHLFAAVARSELELQRPGHSRLLHSRAAEWFTARGNVDEAVRHSIAAGDTESAAVLVQGHWLQFVDAGRIATVLGWLQAIGPPTEATDPAASVTAAWVAALIGDELALTDRLTAMDAFRDHGPLPDGSRSVESAMAMIHGLFGYGGPVEMMRGAERAVALETDRHSPFYALAHVTLGHAAYVAGDLERALAPLANARRSDRAPAIIQALALATESLVEDERRNIGRARECAEAAMEILESHGLRAVPQASLAFTALGQAHAAAGSVDQALVTLEQGLALRRETSAHGPWGMVHHLLVHARVAAEVGQPEAARDLLGDLASRLERYTDGMEAIDARVAAVRRLLQGPRHEAAVGEALTGRELDILRLLQGSMSLQEIAGELYLSFNTVKTHARAVYRKLGVHTRAEAVLAGRQQGLV